MIYCGDLLGPDTGSKSIDRIVWEIWLAGCHTSDPCYDYEQRKGERSHHLD